MKPQVIVIPLPAVAIAALPTTPTCMYLEDTTLTTTSPEAQTMKITHCSGSCGGTTLPQAAGSRSEQKATCPPSWRLCQVKHSLSVCSDFCFESIKLHPVFCSNRGNEILTLLSLFSCFAWQQPPGVRRHWDPLW